MNDYRYFLEVDQSWMRRRAEKTLATWLATAFAVGFLLGVVLAIALLA